MFLEEIVTKKELLDLENRLAKRILAELTKQFKLQEQDEYLKTNEAAKFLKCSVGTLRNRRIEGKLSPVNFDGTLYYSRKELSNSMAVKN
jgi:hypothetical protein